MPKGDVCSAWIQVVQEEICQLRIPFKLMYDRTKTPPMEWGFPCKYRVEGEFYNATFDIDSSLGEWIHREEKLPPLLHLQMEVCGITSPLSNEKVFTNSLVSSQGDFYLQDQIFAAFSKLPAMRKFMSNFANKNFYFQSNIAGTKVFLFKYFDSASLVFGNIYPPSIEEGRDNA
jgi:hypothetical protein